MVAKQEQISQELSSNNSPILYNDKYVYRVWENYMYFADTINEGILNIKPELIGTNSYKQIIKLLRSELGSETLKFNCQRINLPPDEYAVGGVYDSYRNIRHVVLFFSEYVDDFRLAPTKFKEFHFSISQTIQHETVHSDQWKRVKRREPIQTINFKKLYLNYEVSVKDTLEYLIDPDEMDARGHDIAMEIKFYYKNQDAYEVLNNIDKKRKLSSYNYYKQSFKKEGWNVVKPKLLEQVAKWLPHAR